MKKNVLKKVAVTSAMFFLLGSALYTGPCTDLGVESNGCKLYDCQDSFLIDCGDKGKTVIVH